MAVPRDAGDPVSAACEDLRRWATNALAGAKPPAGTRDLAVAASFARGTSTLAAIRLVAAHGYGVQGLMLGQRLFADALMATWLATCPCDDLALRQERHRELAVELTLTAARREPTVDEVNAFLTAEERRLFGGNADGSWTGRSALDRLREVEAAWAGAAGTEDRLDALWTLHDRLRRLEHTFLRNSPLGLEPFLDRPAAEAATARLTGDDGLAPDALVTALATYDLLVAAAIDVLAPEQRNQLAALRDELGPVVRTASSVRQRLSG
jgi:hypothetical protein